MKRRTEDLSNEDFAAYMRAKRKELPKPKNLSEVFEREESKSKRLPMVPNWTEMEKRKEEERERKTIEENLRSRIPGLGEW